jgi:hypothetical protein
LGQSVERKRKCIKLLARREVQSSDSSQKMQSKNKYKIPGKKGGSELQIFPKNAE